MKDYCSTVNANYSHHISTYCEYPVDTTVIPPNSAGCDRELQVKYYCPSNLNVMKIKYYTVFNWEMDTVKRTIECDAPFIYSRKTQYILDVYSESKRGSFSLRYPQQLKYLKYVNDYYEEDDTDIGSRKAKTSMNNL